MFKAGDKVRVRRKDGGQGDASIGEILTIKRVYGSVPIDAKYRYAWSDEDLELIKENKMKDVKFGVKYDRDEDPVEFFETKKEAEKRIKELLQEDDVDNDSIYLFEVAKKWKVNQPISYELEEV